MSIVFSPSLVLAQGSSSGSYQIDEVFIGPGGTVNSGSANYDLRGTLGDIGVGESTSGNFNLLAGYTTDAEPTILFAVNGNGVDLGVLVPDSTGTGAASFSVGTYNADGYVVQTFGGPPTNSGYELTEKTTKGPSAVGTEEFGINLVANTSPAVFGGDPVQQPDGTFSFGTVAADYATTNEFKYTDGDTVALSTQSTGQTDYTVSYIANVSSVTPAGEYRMVHTLVATSTF